MKKIGVIITAYNPEDGIVMLVENIKNDVDLCLIIDNTPGGSKFLKKIQYNNVQVISDGENKGIGKAINIGINILKNNNIQYVFLFDQDSIPDKGYICKALRVYGEIAEKEKVGIIGPVFKDIDSGEKIIRIWDVIKHNNNKIEQLNCLPTSGMLFDNKIMDDIGGFSEDLFLDFVDYEWSWRVKQKNYKIYRINELILLHRLGIKQVNIFGINIHIPASYRHYYQNRDAIKFLSRDYVPKYDKYRLIVLIVVKLIFYPIVFGDRKRRIGWMVKGIVDGFSRVDGIGAPKKILK